MTADGANYTSPTITISAPPPSTVYNTYWSNDGSSVAGSQTVSAVSLPVTKGLYSVLLGDTTVSNMTASIPASVFANANVNLRVWFNDGVNGFQQLTPDQRLAAAGYSLQAQNASVASVATVANSVSPSSIVQGSDLSVGYGSSVGSGLYSSVAGGQDNTASGSRSFVGDGADNTASGPGSFVGGGGYDGSAFFGNTASGAVSAVVGGLDNTASGYASAVGGGYFNRATNSFATVPGGFFCLAGGVGSFAAGSSAYAYDDNTFVWGDGTLNIGDTGPNSFTALASGGFSFYTGTNSGVYLVAGGASWSSFSDRNMKKNFQPVDTVAVLDKLAGIPIQRWNYKWERDDDVPNIGPMAQDFKAAFYPGRDDKGISTLEFNGVELAAIQGLNLKLEQQVKEKEQEISDLRRELDELKAEVHLASRPNSQEKGQ